MTKTTTPDTRAMKHDKQQWMTTYMRLTAEAYLKNLGVRLTPDELMRQLHAKHSLYRQLLRLNAADGYNDFLLEQNRDVLAQLQHKFISWVYSDHYLVEEGQAGYETWKTLENQRLQVVELAETFEQDEQQLQRNKQQSEAYCREQLAEWYTRINEWTKRICKILKAMGATLSMQEMQGLQSRLAQGLDDKPLTDEEKKLYGLKQTASPLVITVLRYLRSIDNA